MVQIFSEEKTILFYKIKVFFLFKSW